MGGVFRAHVEAVVAASHSNGPVGHRCRGEDDEGHGHDWRIEVEWSYPREALSEFGWGIDFGRIKTLINTLDHRNLNRKFAFPPSAENIAIWLVEQINDLPYPTILIQDVSVTIHEGNGNRVEYHEEDN